MINTGNLDNAIVFAREIIKQMNERYIAHNTNTLSGENVPIGVDT
ncbi:hypothetical protein JCM16163A_48910 [Paenibacillus sp. YK5]